MIRARTDPTDPRRPLARKVGLLGASAWLAVSAFASLIFVTRVEPMPPFEGTLYSWNEPIGFAWGFAVSGAVCASAGLGLFRGRRAAIVMGLALLGGLALLTAGVIAGYPELAVRVYGLPRIGIESDHQQRLISAVRIGTILGGIAGASCAAVLALASLIVRAARSRVPRLAGVSALILAVIVAIPVASFRLAELARALGLEHWGPDTRSILGAATGSATGAIAGLVVALLVSQSVTSPAPRSEATVLI